MTDRPEDYSRIFARVRTLLGRNDLDAEIAEQIALSADINVPEDALVDLMVANIRRHLPPESP